MFADSLTKFFQPIVDIRRGEWFKAGLMFLYSFFIFATLYILKPVRSSLYLDTHGAENLWLGYILEGALLFFVTWIYVKFARKFKNKSNFFTFTTLFLISNILGFWIFFKLHLKLSWFVLLFYGWVATYSVTAATQFWTMANDIFNPQETPADNGSLTHRRVERDEHRHLCQAAEASAQWYHRHALTPEEALHLGVELLRLALEPCLHRV